MTEAKTGERTALPRLRADITDDAVDPDHTVHCIDSDEGSFCDMTCPADVAEKYAAAVVQACNAFPALVEALKRAEQFISNGIEFGYISLPDERGPDAAKNTLPVIRSALEAALKTEG